VAACLKRIEVSSCSPHGPQNAWTTAANAALLFVLELSQFPVVVPYLHVVTIHQLFSALFGGFIIGTKHIGPVDDVAIRPQDEGSIITQCFCKLRCHFGAPGDDSRSFI